MKNHFSVELYDERTVPGGDLIWTSFEGTELAISGDGETVFVTQGSEIFSVPSRKIERIRVTLAHYRPGP
jgi:hypothetical protein